MWSMPSTSYAVSEPERCARTVHLFRCRTTAAVTCSLADTWLDSYVIQSLVVGVGMFYMVIPTASFLGASCTQRGRYFNPP